MYHFKIKTTSDLLKIFDDNPLSKNFIYERVF